MTQETKPKTATASQAQVPEESITKLLNFSAKLCANDTEMMMHLLACSLATVSDYSMPTPVDDSNVVLAARNALETYEVVVTKVPVKLVVER